jgi:tetratricopeptide (TPR) repeat protein
MNEQATNTNFPEFDVSLSFSGIDRNYARRIARAAKKRGVRVFLDEWYQSFLWGKKESVFHGIYGHQTKLVVPIISKNYVDSDSARFELDIAIREEKHRKSEFILPVQLDNSIVSGLQGTRNYLHADKVPPAKIARLLQEKIANCTLRSPTIEPKLPQTSVQRQILGLIVTAAIPNVPQFFHRIFPSLPWDEEIPKFQEFGWVVVSETITPTSQAVAAFPESSDEYQTYEAMWITALWELRDHIDIAPIITIHLIRQNRLDEAIDTVGRIAIGGANELGFWNSIYLEALASIFDAYYESVQLDSQLLLLHALGICQSVARQYDKSKESLSRLHALAKSNRRTELVGQALIAMGVNLFESGDGEAACHQYHLAREHAIRHKDWTLLGRAAGNLAEMYRHHDVQRARAYLDESLKAKTKAKDIEGLATTHLQLGNLAIELGDIRQALSSFKIAAKECKKAGLSYRHSLAVHNIATAYRDLGKPRLAIKYYANARSLAVDEEFDYPLSLALAGLGTAYFDVGEYQLAKNAFSELLPVAKRMDDTESKITSLHAMGFCTALIEGSEAAKSLFQEAQRLAEDHNFGELYVRCVVDRTRKLHGGPNGAPDCKKIMAKARANYENKRYGLSGNLWIWLARNSRSTNKEQSTTNEYYTHALTCDVNETSPSEERLEWYMEYAECLWNSFQFAEAIVILERAEQRAADSGFSVLHCVAADKAGVFLQETGRHREAAKKHALAIRVARKCRYIGLLEGFLNNQGECFRRLRRWEKSETAFLEAEALSANRNSRTSISIMHNRALLYSDQERLGEAETLLLRCKRICHSRKDWVELVRTWEGLAQLALRQSNYELCLRRYEKAWKIAKAKRLDREAVKTGLNYASLLLDNSRPKAAIAILSPLAKKTLDPSLSHLVSLVLGQSYQEIGKHSESLRFLESSFRLSKAIGDHDHHLDAAASFAFSLEQCGRYTEAIEVLKSVEESEKNPELWSILMTQLLSSQLHVDSPDCQSTYDRIQRVASKHNLREVIADLHLMIGERQWTGTFDDKCKALQAFAIAIVNGLAFEIFDRKQLGSERDPESDSSAGSIFGHAMYLLTHPSTATTLVELKRLDDIFAEWLRSELRNSDAELHEFARSITRFAIELLPLNRNPLKMSQRMNQLIAEWN